MRKRSEKQIIAAVCRNFNCAQHNVGQAFLIAQGDSEPMTPEARLKAIAELLVGAEAAIAQAHEDYGERVGCRANCGMYKRLVRKMFNEDIS